MGSGLLTLNRLSSRWHIGPFMDTIATNATALGFHLNVGIPYDSSLPYVFGERAIPHDHPHFPYGLPVEPDTHT